MSDTQHPDDGLALQAYLYAACELGAEEQAAFELRLAGERAAQEALAEAVRLQTLLTGGSPSPAPDYRARVRQRLYRAKQYAGHPLLWMAAGAAAALLLSFTFLRPAPEIRYREAEPKGAGTEQLPDPLLRDVAKSWSDNNAPDHLIRTHTEHLQKSRLEDRRMTRRGNLASSD